MKINQIPYVIFQATSQFETLYASERKSTFNVQFFRLFSALRKVYPIPHAIFETARSVSLKITPLPFLAQALYT